MAEDLRLDVQVAARSTGVTAVLAEMRALASATSRIQTATKGAAAGTAAVGAAARTAAPAVGAAARNTQTAVTAMGAMRGAGDAASKGVKKVSDESLRYASYDMAGTLLTVAAAITAVGAASLIAFASQEKAFSSVERILAGDGLGTREIENLRDELYELSEAVPVAFSDLAEIASFGAALDIAAGDLDEFASVVSRFTALTGTDAETAGKSLARIFQYTRESTPSLRRGEEFEQLGSAIVRLGNISISTEADVLQFAQAIAPLGRRAGVSAEQVLAMATATSSFASINVEGAGSAFSRVFAIIERATATGGDQLKAFAEISGMTAASFQSMWAEDAGGAFNRVLEGLNKDIPNLTLNMDELGIRNERDKRVIRALAINYKDYARYMDEANTSVEEGTYLGQSYAFIADDLASKWQIFLNTLQNTGAAIGGVVGPAFAGLLQVLTDVLKNLGDFASSPFGGWVVRIAGVVAGMVAAWAAWRGAIALATAGALAFKTATSFLGGPGIARGAQMLAAQMTGVGVAAQGATGKVAAFGAAAATSGGAAGVGRLRTGLAGVVSFLGGPWGLALGIGAAVFGSAMAQMDSAAREARARIVDSLNGVTQGVESAVAVVQGTNDANWFMNLNADQVSQAASNLGFALEDVSRIMDATYLSGGQLETSNAKLANSFGLAEGPARDLDTNLNTLRDSLNDLAPEPARLAATLGALGDQYGWTTQDLLQFTRLLDDHARAALVSYGRQLGLTGNEQAVLTQLFQNSGAAARASADGTDIASASIEMLEESAAEAAAEVDALIEAFLELSTGAKSVQQAQDALSGAFNKVRDEAEKLRGSGRGLKDILSATDDEAIKFRDSLFDLEQKAREAAIAILQNGGSVEEAQKKYQEGRQAIIDIATAMGVPPEKAKAWADEMFDSAEAINGDIAGIGESVDAVNKKDIELEATLDAKKYHEEALKTRRDADGLDKRIIRPTVDANTTPFDRDYSGTKGRIQELGRSEAKPIVGVRKDLFDSGYYRTIERMREMGRARATPNVNLQGNAQSRAAEILRQLHAFTGTWWATANLTVNRYFNDYGDGGGGGRWAHPSYATGGFTGRGGRLQEAGIVHKGEYVVPKHMVNQSTGLPFADALGKLTRGHETGLGYSNGGHVSQRTIQGPSTVSLSPGTIQQIAQAVQPYLVMDGSVVAQSVNRQNARLNRVGEY